MKRHWMLRAAIVVAAAACMAPGCNGDVLSDPTFHIWCGENLCSWKTNEGSVRRVPTWHANDYGVELVATPTQISQETTEGSDCMEFSAVADVDARAQVKIQVDFTLDGTPDFEETIAETHWRPTKTILHAPPGHGSHFRFIIRKEGTGHAALAEMRLQRATSCPSPPIELKDLEVGDTCAKDAECKDGLCDTVSMPLQDGGTTVLPGTCGACSAARPCADGLLCRKPDGAELDLGADRFFFDPRPSLCAPGEGKGATGTACVAGGDCASATCEGVLLHPNRGCDAGIGLEGSSCKPTGVRAGRCR
jgi:hypothetical protein